MFTERFAFTSRNSEGYVGDIYTVPIHFYEDYFHRLNIIWLLKFKILSAINLPVKDSIQFKKIIYGSIIRFALHYFFMTSY